MNASRASSRRSGVPLLATSMLVVTASIVMLVAGGRAHAASAIQGVHGAGLITRSGFTAQYVVDVTRQPSGSLSGHIQAKGGTWMVQASPNGLVFHGNAACVSGEVERGFTDSGTPDAILILIQDVPNGRDLIASAVGEGSFGDPEFACFALARSLVLPPVPELTAGNFTLIGN